MMFSSAAIEIFLNTAGALSQLNGLSNAFTKTADKIQNNFISKLGALALGGAGLKGLTGIYDEAVKIQNLAESWKLPVEKVGKFANAFTLLGGTTEDALGSIEKLQQLSNQLRFDSSGALRDLSARLGVNLLNKDYQGAINSLRGSFRGLNSNAQKKVLDMLGMDNLPMLRMLRLSNEEYAKLNQDAENYGTITQRTAISLKNMELAFQRIKVAIKGIMFRNLEKAIPLFDKLSEKFTILADLSPNVKEQILGVTAAIVGLGPALRLIGVLAGSVFSPMTIGIAGVVAGAYMLYKNWDKVNKVVKKYIDESPNLNEFLSNTQKFFEAIGEGLKWLSDNFSQSEFMQNLKDIFTGVETAFKYMFWKTSNALGGAVAGGQILANGGSWSDAWGAIEDAVEDEIIPISPDYSSAGSPTNTDNSRQVILNIGTMNTQATNGGALVREMNRELTNNGVGGIWGN